MNNILSTLQNYTDLTTLLSYSLTCKTLYYWYYTATHVYAGYKLNRHYVNFATKLSLTPNAVHLIGNLFESVYTLLYSLYNKPGKTALISMSDTPNNRLAQCMLTKWNKFTVYKHDTVVKRLSSLIYYARVVVLDFDDNADPARLTRSLNTLSLKVFYLSDKINTITSGILNTCLYGINMMKLSNLRERRIAIVNCRTITPYITTGNLAEYAYNIGSSLLSLQYHVINGIVSDLIIVDIPNVLIYGSKCIASYDNLYTILPYISLQHSVHVVVSTINNVNIEDIKRILLVQCSLGDYDTITLNIIDLRKILGV